MEVKKVKIKNSVLLQAGPILTKILELKLGVKTSYAIAKTLRGISPHLELVNELRQKIINKYVDLDVSGLPIIIKDEETGVERMQISNRDEFVKEMDALLLESEEISVYQVSLDDLSAAETMTPGEMMLLLELQLVEE